MGDGQGEERGKQEAGEEGERDRREVGRGGR